MKSFKVIREYPYGLPINSIVKEDKDGRFYCDHNGKSLDIGHNPSDFPWVYEEIGYIKKDYIVLEYKSKATGLIHSLKSDGLYSPNDVRDNELFESKCYFINKIKRVSDGEIFEVGDKFTFNGIGGLHDTIKSFKFRQNGEIAVSYGNGIVAVRKISKVNRMPVFKSHDGQDMYIGDEYCWVYLRNDDSKIRPYTVICNEDCVVSPGMRFNNKNAVFFSDINRAKAWIELNKPRYSITDLRESIVFRLNTYQGKFRQVYAIDPEKLEGLLEFKDK